MAGVTEGLRDESRQQRVLQIPALVVSLPLGFQFILVSARVVHHLLLCASLQVLSLLCVEQLPGKLYKLNCKNPGHIFALNKNGFFCICLLRFRERSESF